MAGATARDDAHLAGDGRVESADNFVFMVNSNEVGMRSLYPEERIFDDIVDIIDEFLHKVESVTALGFCLETRANVQAGAGRLSVRRAGSVLSAFWSLCWTVSGSQEEAVPQLLIADDNRQVVSILEEYATQAGFEVARAYDGPAALRLARRRGFDIILLDVMMPGLDGFEVCRQLRQTSDVPIIMVTARSEDYERIMGLDVGADDYIVKPFSPGEVMARVRAVLRRVQPSAGPRVVEVAGLRVDLDDYRSEVGGVPVALTKKETELLWLLARHHKKVFTRENLLESLWGFDYEGDMRTVDSHVKRLRAKLDRVDHPGWAITTVWGVGYRFEVTP